jgi:hypothetical protein
VFFAVPAVLFLILWQAQSPVPTQAEDSYCSQAADYAAQNRNTALLFSAVPQNPTAALDRWHPVKTNAELQTKRQNGQSTAVVTVRDGHLIFAVFELNNQFGDSSETAQYCFRADGTLAELRSDLRSYHGDMRVIREAAYTSSGELSRSSTQSSDLTSGKPKAIPSDFWDQPAPVFLHVGDLPFAKQLQHP